MDPEDQNCSDTCDYEITGDCEGATGIIQTYQDFQFFGKFRIVLKSCANSYAVFSMYDANFTLGTDSNTISFGSGPAVGENLVLTIRGQSNGENELPGAAVRYDYTSKNNEVWIELDAPVYGVNLAITYRIELELITTVTLTEESGTIEPVYKAGQRYHYLIQPSNSGYKDLMLTVDYFNITGSYDFGDYVKIGPGLDPYSSKRSIMLSWSLERNTKFLIEGHVAHLVLASSRDSQTSDYTGLSMTYTTLDKNLTTPAPTVTPPTPAPTPFPLDRSKLRTSIILLTSEEIDLTGDEIGWARTELIDVLFVLLNNTLDSVLQPNWNLVAPFRNDSIELDGTGRCDRGWAVDVRKCVEVFVVVNSFKTADNITEYTFPVAKVEAAIRSSPEYYPKKMTFRKELTDVLTWAAIISALVSVLILMGCIVIWKVKVNMDYTERAQKQKLYRDLRRGKGSTDAACTTPTPTAFSPTPQGISNPNFINDEDDVDNAITFDPGNGKLYSPRPYEDSHGYGSESRSRRIAPNPFSNNNEVSDSQFDSDDDSYEAIPKPAKPYTKVAIPPAVQVASVRGILKKTVVPPMILDEELEEVTLYDHEPPLEPVSSRTKPGATFIQKPVITYVSDDDHYMEETDF